MFKKFLVCFLFIAMFSSVASADHRYRTYRPCRSEVVYYNPPCRSVVYYQRPFVSVTFREPVFVRDYYRPYRPTYYTVRCDRPTRVVVLSR